MRNSARQDSAKNRVWRTAGRARRRRVEGSRDRVFLDWRQRPARIAQDQPREARAGPSSALEAVHEWSGESARVSRPVVVSWRGMARTFSIQSMRSAHTQQDRRSRAVALQSKHRDSPMLTHRAQPRVQPLRARASSGMLRAASTAHRP